METLELTQRLVEECDRLGIAFDANQDLIKSTPGCYVFYGTPLNDDCRRYGYCRQLSYYALVEGRNVIVRTRGF